MLSEKEIRTKDEYFEEMQSRWQRLMNTCKGINNGK